MIEEYWDVQWINGQWYSLHDYTRHVESIYGARTDVPSLRGSNVAVYGKPGQLHQPKMADQRVITLQGWVSNTDETDKPIGDDGEGLSAGERRRVALARALVRIRLGGAWLLILDEPTAGLDADTEAQAIEAVRSSGAGALIVSHRPAVLAAADRVVEVVAA